MVWELSDVPPSIRNVPFSQPSAFHHYNKNLIMGKINVDPPLKWDGNAGTELPVSSVPSDSSLFLRYFMKRYLLKSLGKVRAIGGPAGDIHNSAPWLHLCSL